MSNTGETHKGFTENTGTLKQGPEGIHTLKREINLKDVIHGLDQIPRLLKRWIGTAMVDMHHPLSREHHESVPHSLHCCPPLCLAVFS